jgi:hypothetical protein
MVDLGDVASRVSGTFQALPSFKGPNMGQFNLGPVNFGGQLPGPAMGGASLPGPAFGGGQLPSGINFGGLGLQAPNFGGVSLPGLSFSGLATSPGAGMTNTGLPIMGGGSGVQLNNDGTKFIPPPPATNQPNAPVKNAGPYQPSDVESYIRYSAAKNHIDPEIAVSVARNEGLNTYIGDQGSSFGPFQLHVGGKAPAGSGNEGSGLGDTFRAQTDLDPTDPKTWKDQVDWVMNYLAKGGDWSPWHGAIHAGVSGKMGIGTYNGPVPEYLDSYQPKTTWEQTAESQMSDITGKPYHWGGHDPTTGFDCSGFVSWVFGQQGINLTPQTSGMFAQTVPSSQPKSGDLVFFNMNTNDPHLQHVGIYMGDGTFINDTDWGGKSGVQISKISDWANQHPEFRSVTAQ